MTIAYRVGEGIRTVKVCLRCIGIAAIRIDYHGAEVGRCTQTISDSITIHIRSPRQIAAVGCVFVGGDAGV